MRTGAIGASLLLVAVGAILAFAVTAEAEGLDINAAGWILMIVGGVGLIVSLFTTLVSSDRGERVVERERQRPV
ncbi:MAG TPA: DUF6458 family protein [Acidimicrobiales bacterium]|nr:DUF6458 family protein [Acidimicrobiales bacterium]